MKISYLISAGMCAILMSSMIVGTIYAEESTAVETEAAAISRSIYNIPATYTRAKAFTGSFGFGDADVVYAENEDGTAFYLTFVAFGEGQVLEGKIVDGFVSVDYDKTGFMSADAQNIYASAISSDAKWQELSNDVPRAAYGIPEEYTKVKFFTGSYGFGDADVICAVNDDETIFYLTFVSFGEEQIIEGTSEDGNITITYDKTGFMSADAPAIFEDSLKSEAEWQNLTDEDAVNVLENTKSAETVKNEWNDAYEIINIPTELEVRTIWQSKATSITETYSTERTGEIIFYGASNFALWTEMEDDMSEYKVQNHAFGGSTDPELVAYSDQLLFPYKPGIIVFQTGSNDYLDQSGTEEEMIEKCVAYKKAMFEAFHKQLPDAKMIVMSGLIIPGRAEYTDLTIEINNRLQKLADETDYLYFVDATDLTYDGTNIDETLFIEDGLHLTHDARLVWYSDYIKPAIEQVISDFPELESVRN